MHDPIAFDSLAKLLGPLLAPLLTWILQRWFAKPAQPALPAPPTTPTTPTKPARKRRRRSRVDGPPAA